MSNRNNSTRGHSLNLVLIVSVLVVTGCALIVFGCVFEAQSKLDLLRAGGPAALNAWLGQIESHKVPFAAFMFESVTGQAYVSGAFLKGLGFWFVFVVAPLVALIGVARFLASRERNMRLHVRFAVVR
jgi:hypothetical protein